MHNQDDSELSELEREYVEYGVLVIKEAIAQLKADGKFCKLQCSCCELRYREGCISELLKRVKAHIKKSQI